MKLKDTVHLPKLSDLGEFGRAEFANGVADIRNALIDEAWFDRASSSVTRIDQPSLGWTLPEERRGDDFFSRRGSDAAEREQPEHDHPQELDFDR